MSLLSMKLQNISSADYQPEFRNDEMVARAEDSILAE
jgi:hypothetical protein